MSIPPTKTTRDDGAARRSPRGSVVVAVILSIGIVIALNIFALTLLFDAFRPPSRLSENAAQILLSWGAGIIGVIGTAVGFEVGRHFGRDTDR
jgi:hypothetical protein